MDPFFLQPAPALCRVCGGEALVCAHGDCLRPWRAEPGLEGWHALFLARGETHARLKAWKRAGDPEVAHRIRRAFAERERAGELEPPAGGWIGVIPVPSAPDRDWVRRFAPVPGLAAELSRLTGVPVLHALRADPGSAPGARGQLDLDARLARLTLRADGRILGRALGARADVPVLLVDDFSTSGSTAREAVRALVEACPPRVRLRVRVWVAGWRDLRSDPPLVSSG